MSRFPDLSIFSKVKPETLKWVLDYIRECPACYDITERNKYEFLKKCVRCKRYRGYKPCVDLESLQQEDVQEDYSEEMILQEMSEEMAIQEETSELPDFSFEEVEFLKSCLEDLEEIPIFSEEEVEYLQWCLEI